MECIGFLFDFVRSVEYFEFGIWCPSKIELISWLGFGILNSIL